MMLPTLTYLSLALALFQCLVFCDAQFIRPPEIDEDRKSDTDLGKNVRYDIGYEIQLDWKSTIEGTQLWIMQLNKGSVNGAGSKKLRVSRTEWEAEYNFAGLSKNGEDSVYYFTLWERSNGYFAQSITFNVTAPDPETTTTTISKVLSITRTTTQSIAESTTQSEPSTTEETIATSTTIAEDDTGATPNSGLSKGETAGVAVGGTIGGLLIFGCVGWLLWKQISKKKRDQGIYEVPAEQLPVSEPKVELPGDHGSHIPGYARSPPGVFEAP
ncbi:hypothetical protein FAUST_1103 [Fusarium austroamericanum]|uniref:Mid2 domain-containing protein n=1 Tax=Fusarium austroamericanum TaxID=282268 RepID=A0AAN6HK13_FUSAU|nr:hypothetical protein FAUST_1103 [Fusarium austroamericanum]